MDASDPILPGQDRSRVPVERLCREVVAGEAGRGIAGFAVSRTSAARYVGVVVASSPVAAQLEETQDTLSEGPGPLALAIRSPVLVPDLGGDPSTNSWLAFRPAAAALGVSSVFVFPVQVGAADLGLLTLHARNPIELSDAALRDVLRLSGAIALALLIPQPMPPAPENVTGVLSLGHAIVQQAVGMVSVQLDTSLDLAMAALRAHAFATDSSLRDVARAVVDRRMTFRDGGEERDDVADRLPRDGRERGDDDSQTRW